MQGNATLAQIAAGCYIEKDAFAHDILARLEESSSFGYSRANRYKCPLCMMEIGCPNCGEIHQDRRTQREHMMSHSMQELKELQLALYMAQE